MATDLTIGPVSGHLRRQATPMALGLVAMISFDAVDLFFVSRLGDAPLAAISFAFPVIWLLSSINIGFEAGAASCVARAVGRNDDKMARRQTTDTALLAALASVILCTIGLFTIVPVFRLLGATDDLIPLVDDYMGIWYFSEPAAAIMWTCLAAMRARGNSLLEGKIIAAAAIINAILDPIFIFGLFGFPRLEIAGAALATLVANLIMLVATIVLLHVRLKVFATPFTKLSNIFASWRLMLHVGLPATVTNAIVPIANGIVVSMVAVYGVDSVAGLGIGLRVEPLFLIPFYALSAVSSPFMGQNIAAQRFDRMAEAHAAIGKFCAGYGIVVALILLVVARPLTGLFSENAAIHAVAMQYLWIICISYAGYGLVMALCASFNGIGNPGPGVVLSAARVFVLFLPLAFAGRALFGLPGIFVAASASNIVVGALAFVWFGMRLNERRHEMAVEPFARE